MEDLFLKISRREIPSDCVYEDEHTFAFLDIRPTNKGHTLVIPKTYARDIFEIDEETFAHLTRTVHKVARAVRDALGADGINLVMNNGSAAGQEVPHAHIHIIPRFSHDGVFVPPQHTEYQENEAREIALRIAKLLS